MKKALSFCVLVLTALSYVCASGIAEVSVSGASKTITKVADKANVTYDIISDLPFGWQNSGFTASNTIANTPSITIIAIRLYSKPSIYHCNL